MELITYRKTLDVHKNGTQFLLQGFETADKLSRVIEISLMASGDAIDFPLERMAAIMYVTSPGAKEPSYHDCTIVDNKVVYNVLPIAEEGITIMQLKLIETSPEGAKRVLASPQFAVEVTKSNLDDNGAELKVTFSAIENFIAKAEEAHRKRITDIELASDCMFRIFYADGTTYESDVLKKLFHNGNVLLSESYAHGNTGVRAGEDTDNSKYYSDISRTESLKAQNIMAQSEKILEDVRLHGMYTAFTVNFDTGKLEYVSPKYTFNINKETGELEAVEQDSVFREIVNTEVSEWLLANGININNLHEIASNHQIRIDALTNTSASLNVIVSQLNDYHRRFFVETLENAISKTDVQAKLGIPTSKVLWTNPNRLEDGFAAQTISVDTTPYKRFSIIFYEEGAHTETIVTEKGITYTHGGKYNSSYDNHDNDYRYRTFQISNDGIYFGEGRNPQGSAFENNAIVPYRVIGYTF